MQHAILLVESDGVLRDAIAFQLRDDGYFVVALSDGASALAVAQHNPLSLVYLVCHRRMVLTRDRLLMSVWTNLDRKSTRLNSSHLGMSYAVFCLKKNKERAVRCSR